MISRQVVNASLSLLVFFSLAGTASCSSIPENDGVPQGGTSRESGEHEGGIITTRVNKPVPIEQYLISGEQWKTLTDAEHLLRLRCMERFGVNYQDTQPEKVAGQSITDYRYGIIDPSYAERYGYRTPGARQSKSIEADIKRQDEVYRALPDSTFLVLYGSTRKESQSKETRSKGRDYAGEKIPQGGCIGEAHRKLYGSWDGSDAEIADDINIKSYAASMKDRTVRAAFAKWSSCMNDHGYDYKVPRDADNDKRWMAERVTAVERETAKVDAECKIKFNVTGIWYGADVAHQEKLIREHSKELATIKKTIGELIARALLELDRK
ncbi:hypothetical protein [Streptomyces sp. NPDC047973]|uniref:hypothetical protein n=1 Tax=Streptomyces sp. NPDC047973 TaxID=3155383 RepID=UPI00343FD4B7